MTEADYIKAKLKELVEVERAATPGPWVSSDFSGKVICKGPEEVQTNHNHGTRSWTDVVATPQHGFSCEPGSDAWKNMVMIAEFRNAAPGILRAMEILVEACGAIDKSDSFYSTRQCDVAAYAISGAARALGFEDKR